MQGFSADLRRFMESKGLSQAEIAKQAQVHQATVSRALRHTPKRYSEAIAKICKYAGLRLADEAGESAPEAIKKAFESVWDGTPEHAIAITRIIEATRGLRPRQE